MHTGLTASRAYQELARWLVGASFRGCSTPGGVVDCSFTRGGAPFHVLSWTPVGTVSVPVPAGLKTLTRLDGSSAPAWAPWPSPPSR